MSAVWLQVPGRLGWSYPGFGGFVCSALAAGVAALLACATDRCAFAAEQGMLEAPSFDGTWHWNFTMPNGTTSHPKLVLETEDDGVVTGTTSFRPGSESAITNAVVRGSQIRFQVVRTRDNRPIVTTYTGTLSGRVIRGTVESNWAGENRTYPWEARRTHDGAGGYWSWTVSVRGRNVENRVRLAERGSELTGYIPGSGRGARLVRISRGSVKDGELYFEIERGTGDTKVLTVYEGKQTGDRIKGTMTTITGGRKQEAPWNAVRTN